jgi:hypothetical protein
MLRVIGLATLIALLAFFAALVGMSLMSSRPPPREQTTNQAEEYNPTNETSQNEQRISWGKLWTRTFTDPVAFFTAALAVFSAGLLVVAALQIWLLLRAEDVSRIAANAAKDSAQIAREALVTSQRAFIRAAGFPWLWRPDTDRTGKYFFDIQPTLENAGNTPTVDASINVNSSLREKPLPDDFDFPYVGEPGEAVIGSKQSVGVNNAIILDDDLLAVQQGKKFFYIWGTATYRDVFEGTPVHTTQFCTQIQRVIGNPLDPRDPNVPKGTSVEIYFRIHPKHNKTD